MLMGIYSAIRNPRSHGSKSDTAEAADAIIYFVDYLLGLIDKARSPYDATQTIIKVFDPLFSQSDKYADLIVGKVPTRKLLDVLIQIFHRRTETPRRNVELFVGSALKVLNEDEQSSFWQVVSELLESASSDSEFRSVISVAQGNWQKISDIARMRTEHRLIESIREGEYDHIKRTIFKGALGNWAVRIIDEMELKKEYATTVAMKIVSGSTAGRAYAYEFHFDVYRRIEPVPRGWVINSLKARLKENDQQTRKALSFVGEELFADDQDEKWIAALKGAYAVCDPTPEISDDDIPF